MNRGRVGLLLTTIVALIALSGGLRLSAQSGGVCGDGALCSDAGCTSGPNGGPEQCDNGAGNSDTAPDVCRTNCALPGCGDGVIDTGEACDDGNVVDGDGCSADCRRCQDKDQQACINAMNKGGAKVAATQGKENINCVKNAVKGKLSLSVEECLTADLKGKVAKAGSRNVSGENKKCLTGSLPDFAYSSAVEANAAAAEEEQNLVFDLFGTNLEQPLSPASFDRRCQPAVMKRTEKLAAEKIKQFLRCKKTGLKSESVCSPADLEACFDEIIDDPKGKTARALGKLEADIGNKCTANTVNMSAAFPGECAGAANFSECVDERVSCRVCVMLSTMDNVKINCDLFDDGIPNGSCFSPFPTPTPTATPVPSPTVTPTPIPLLCGDTLMTLSIGPDPIQVQYGQSSSVTAMGTPFGGQYHSWSVKNESLDATLQFTNQPICQNSPDCTSLLLSPEIELPAPDVPRTVCGTAEVQVSYRCLENGLSVTGTGPVEVGCGGKGAAECTEFCSQESVQGQCGTPCGLVGVTPPAYSATKGSCWKVNVNGTEYCYWDYKSQNAPGLGSLCCPNRCFGASFVVWGQGSGVYACTVIERCADNPEFAGTECVDATGTVN